MPLTLNKVADEIVGQHTEYQEGRLAKLLAEPAGSRIRSNPVRYANSLAAITFDLGMGYYQQERPAAQIKGKLSLAAQYLAEAITERQPSATDMWQPTEYEKALALAFCFGSPQTLTRVLGATDDQIFSQPDPKNAALYRNSFAYCQIVRDYLAGKPLDLSAVEKTIASCQQPNAWKFDAVGTLNKLRALEAIEHRDSSLFGQSLTTLVNDHQNEALHGDLQKLTDANMATPVMLLAKLGKVKADFAAKVTSPYLPVNLL